MAGLLKRLFGRGEKQSAEEEKPGRTFKCELMGDYFGLRNSEASKEQIQKAKEDKIEKIKALGLVPKFLRYAYKKDDTGHDNREIAAAHVVFQKEEYDQKFHMVHVTEISFIVHKEEFDEFEEMAGVSLKDDFRNLYEAEKSFEGKERRRSPRPSPLDILEMD